MVFFDNQEDSIVINQSAIDRGLFRVDSLKNYNSEIKKNPSTSQDDIFTKPDPNRVTGMKQADYNKLNDKGYIIEETPITNNDIIIGKISPIQSSQENKGYKDDSTVFKSNVDGVIDRVHTGINNSEGYEMYNVRVRMERIPIIGDKFCLLPNTEVLTTIGWIEIKYINQNHEVACLNKNNELYYTKPINIYKFKHSGKLYKISNMDIELTTTFDHQMYVCDYGSSEFKLKTVNEIKGKPVGYKKNAINKNNADIRCINVSYNDMNIALDILELLIAIGNKLTRNIKSENIDIQYYVEKLTVGNKLPEFTLSLSQRQSLILLNSILFNETLLILADNKEYADQLSILALNAGYSANVRNFRTTYFVSIIKDDIIMIDGLDETIIDYVGDVHCIEVPDHVFYVRENGKSIWTGNSSRHGQKGTIGLILQQKDMPFTEEGIHPDLIINPCCMPSRMTVGQIVEMIAGKEAASCGYFIDGTPFNDYDTFKLPEIMKKLGYSPQGTEIMYCGMTGKKMDAEIFIGPVYQIRLKHMVQDKVHGRARGPRKADTRQPLEGRSRDGGLRIGKFCLKALMQIRC